MQKTYFYKREGELVGGSSERSLLRDMNGFTGATDAQRDALFADLEAYERGQQTSCSVSRLPGSDVDALWFPIDDPIGYTVWAVRDEGKTCILAVLIHRGPKRDAADDDGVLERRAALRVDPARWGLDFDQTMDDQTYHRHYVEAHEAAKGAEGAKPAKTRSKAKRTT